MTEHLESMRAVYGRPYPDATISDREMRWALMGIAEALGQPGDPCTTMSDPLVMGEVLRRLGIREHFKVAAASLTYQPEFNWNDE